MDDTPFSTERWGQSCLCRNGRKGSVDGLLEGTLGSPSDERTGHSVVVVHIHAS